jgi:hypothetical protein
MISIFKQVEISSSKNGYLLTNQRTNKSISLICSESDIKDLSELFTMEESNDPPSGHQFMPKSYEDQFFKEIES